MAAQKGADPQRREKEAGLVLAPNLHQPRPVRVLFFSNTTTQTPTTMTVAMTMTMTMTMTSLGP